MNRCEHIRNRNTAGRYIGLLVCLSLLLAAAGAAAQEVDVLIDGNGEGVYGDPGSGAGGTAIGYATSPGVVTFTLEIRNFYTKKNKYTITWNQVPGWVTTIDNVPSPYQTPNINPGEPFFVTFQASVPEGVAPAEFPFTLDVQAVKFRDKPWESVSARVQVTTQLFGIVRGRVFDDRDHDGVFSAGDVGMSGVTVREDATGGAAISAGDGSYEFMVPAGVPVSVFEENPSGYLSLSADTLGPFVLAAGDTVQTGFADVPPLTLTPGVTLNGLAGGYVDFPHRLVAGTTGQVTLQVTAASGSVTMLLLDANGNGVFDSGDRVLQPSDYYLDPVSGTAAVDILLRVFVPAGLPPGSTIGVLLDATQSVENTVYSFHQSATDVVIVTGTAVGMLTLSKQADISVAVPGDSITYTIDFLNAGADTIQNVVLLDPVSAYVDLAADAFGPGHDVAWRMNAQPIRYLTIDPLDGDECEYSASERLLRIIFSKNSPVLIAPGEGGSISYTVIVQ